MIIPRKYKSTYDPSPNIDMIFNRFMHECIQLNMKHKGSESILSNLNFSRKDHGYQGLRLKDTKLKYH